jgi:uncharacterized protein (TIGR02284 family)
MEQHEQIIEGLNDLIQIHNDRINTYRKIYADLDDFDSDIERICQRIVRQSELHISQLVDLVDKLHSNVVKTHGKAYRIWLKLKGIYMEKDRVSILNSFDFNEEAAEKAYDYAVTEIHAPEEIKNTLIRQRSSLKITHDIVKEFNDREFIVTSA